MTGDDFSRLLQVHRSIREFEDRPVARSLVDRVLVDALHGSSSSGNLNMVSVIKTFDVKRKKRLCELHFEQPMVLQAPRVLTFCADSHRTRQWLAQRGARLRFGDFISSPIASFDRRRLDDRSRGIAAVGSAKLNVSKGSKRDRRWTGRDRPTRTYIPMLEHVERWICVVRQPAALQEQRHARIARP